MYFILLLALPFLTQCATPHQPQVFPQYFPSQPESVYAPKHVYETRELEKKSALTYFEKKRLSDLYSLEYSTSKLESRKAEIKQKLDLLKPEVAPIEEETRDLQEKNRKAAQVDPKKDEDTFGDPLIRARFSEAQSLWNKDFNEDALILLRSLRESSLPDRGLLKIEYLYFRILLEKGDAPGAEESLRRIHGIDDCAFEAANGAFLLALQLFGSGNLIQAAKVLSDQCDEDKTPGNLNRRAYWLARFTTGEAERKTKLEEIANKNTPDYYSIMSRYQLRSELAMPLEYNTPRSYLVSPVSVPRKIDRLLTLAEESLKANLKRDASTYLTRVAQILKDRADSDDVATALYVAHLFQAAGNHLEAMKIFNSLPQIVKPEMVSTLTHPQLIREMFPTPFKNRVEWLCNSWQTDPDIVYALMRQESAFNPTAISSADARGLMQLMPFLAKYLAKLWRYDRYYQPKNLLSADENLKLAVFHLYQLRNLTPHIALIASSYNAGVSRTTNWWRRYGRYPLDVFIEFIPVQETRFYVKYVLRNYVYYKMFRQGRATPALLWSMELPTLPGDIPLENLDTPKIESPQGNP